MTGFFSKQGASGVVCVVLCIFARKGVILSRAAASDKMTLAKFAC